MNKKFYDGIFMEQENLRQNGIYHQIKIDYYKTEKLLEDKSTKKYGIEIVKTEYKDEETKVECNEMYEISNKESEINEILEIFKQNEVTPICAEDVIEDYLYSLNKN